MKKFTINGFNYNVPGDISSASFIIAGALLMKGSEIHIQNVLFNKTRIGFINVLKKMNAKISISNIVMFGLILAVGMLVDGAIIIVEYADKEIKKNVGPMRAYSAAAKRMFWPIISSTATTLCAFLPMLFWPGVAGQFMGNLPVTIIFVLSASLIVVLIYLPVVGGVTGRISRKMESIANKIQNTTNLYLRIILFACICLLSIFTIFCIKTIKT